MTELNLDDLDLLQQDIFTWLRRNFPDATAQDEFYGVVEEVGELAHADLKHREKIRNLQDPEVAFDAKVDAVGDLIIYLMNYCSLTGISFRAALEETWSSVVQRDWVANPNP